MKKKVVLSWILFGLSLFILLFSFSLKEPISKLTSGASSEQAAVQLFNEGGSSCGNGTCDSGETCSSCAADCGECSVTPSGGGGGGGAAVTKAVKYDKEMFKVISKVGETFKTSLQITNPTSQAVKFSFNSSLEESIAFSENSFRVSAGATKEIFITFSSNLAPGVYTGEIIILEGSKMRKIPVIFEIESEKVIFDVTLDVPSKYKELFAGEDLLLQLTLYNLGGVGKVDVFVEYLIKDFEGNIILSQKDVVAVETSASFSRMISLPPNLKAGDYVAIVQTSYDSSIGTASNVFRIKERNIFKGYEPYILSGIILIVIVVTIVIVLRREHGKLKKSIRIYSGEVRRASKKIKEDTKNTIAAGKISQKLKVKRGVLERAYREGHINKKSYEIGSRRIKTASDELKRKYL